jgi:hypothetical protein
MRRGTRSQRPKIAKTENDHTHHSTKYVSREEENLQAPNPELNLKTGEVATRFKFKTRGGELNNVVEVGPGTRKKLLQTKLKMGWLICSVGDYLVAKMCFKCSKYNHRHQEC